MIALPEMPAFHEHNMNAVRDFEPGNIDIFLKHVCQVKKTALVVFILHHVKELFSHIHPHFYHKVRHLNSQF